MKKTASGKVDNQAPGSSKPLLRQAQRGPRQLQVRADKELDKLSAARRHYCFRRSDRRRARRRKSWAGRTNSTIIGADDRRTSTCRRRARRSTCGEKSRLPAIEMYFELSAYGTNSVATYFMDHDPGVRQSTLNLAGVVAPARSRGTKLDGNTMLCWSSRKRAGPTEHNVRIPGGNVGRGVGSGSGRRSLSGRSARLLRLRVLRQWQARSARRESGTGSGNDVMLTVA